MSSVTNTFQLLLDALDLIHQDLAQLHTDMIDVHGHITGIESQTDLLEFEAVTHYLEVKTH